MAINIKSTQSRSAKKGKSYTQWRI